VLAFGLGFVSFVALHAIPHWNYTGWRSYSPIMVADVAVGTILALAIAIGAPRPWGALAGTVGAAFPLAERILTGQRYDLFHRWWGIQFPGTEIGPPLGLYTQVAVVVLALLVGLRLPRGRRPDSRRPDGRRPQTAVRGGVRAGG
jgi:hypothetical protein